MNCHMPGCYSAIQIEIETSTGEFYYACEQHERELINMIRLQEVA